MRCFRFVFGELESGFHRSVERVAGDALAVAGSDQFFVEAPVFEINVGQQSLIAVAFFPVELPPKELAFYGSFGEGRRFGAEWFNWFGRMLRFGSVDADQSNSFVVLKDECVAIDDVHDSPRSVTFRY
jgi:hypothetical protein